MDAKTSSFDLMDYIKILKKYKWLILVAGIVSGLSTGVTSLSAPRTYQSKVTFFVFLEKQGGSGYLENIASGLFSTPIGSNAMVEALIQSRRMAEGIMDRFYPQQGLKRKSRERTIARIQRMVRTVPFGGGNNSLAIEVTATDGQLAADIANFCVDYLEILNQKLQLSAEKQFTKVLDAAVPPLYPTSRKVVRKVFVATALAVLLTSCAAFFIEYVRHIVGLDRISGR